MTMTISLCCGSFLCLIKWKIDSVLLIHFTNGHKMSDFGKTVHFHIFNTGDIITCFKCGKIHRCYLHCSECESQNKICSCYACCPVLTIISPPITKQGE